MQNTASFSAIPSNQRAIHASFAAISSKPGSDLMSSLGVAADSGGVFQRRVVQAGEAIYRSGTPFDEIYILDSGVCKLLNLAADGREQVVSFKFRGDWLGFDGIASGAYTCDAVAMDTGAVWTASYDAVLGLTARTPSVLRSLHVAMSRAIVGDRDSLMSVCTLGADARVADFLRFWAESLKERGMRCDQISLRLTRAEIGNFLGMTLETVSRSLSKLAKAGIIIFTEPGRREIRIPDLAALAFFVQETLAPSSALH